MKENNGITLVSLAITIIILIILAGISINMTIGNNGILTISKRARENVEIAQIEEKTKLNELYEQIIKEEGALGEISYDAIEKLNLFKKAIADYIEEAGGIKPEYTADTETFGQRIKEIVKEVTKDATATESDIAEGKTAWVNGNKIVGTSVTKVAEGTWRLGLTIEVTYMSSGSARTTFNPICDVTLKDGNLTISYINDNAQSVSIIGKTIYVDPVNNMTIKKIK